MASAQVPGRRPELAAQMILGFEDVTVPYGTLTDCLKIVRILASGQHRLEGRAKGVGMAKRLRVSGSTGVLYELETHTRE